MHQTVVCMKWGSLYGAEYVNKLYSMVSRNTMRPLRFVCFTDDSSLISEKIETHPLPSIILPDQMINMPWRKISLWQDPLLDLEGDILFLDLDLVITNSIDDFFDYKKEETFCVIHNWTTKSKLESFYNKVGNTSCYRFRVGAHTYIFENIQRNPIYYLTKYRNSQTYISNEISKIEYWPDNWCVSFKHSLLPLWPRRIFVPAYLPPDTKLVAFTGKPDVHDVIDGSWPEKNPIKRLFRRFVVPDWIESHWR